MKQRQRSMRKLVIAGGALCAALAAPVVSSALVGIELGVIRSAEAANHGGGGQAGQRGQGGAAAGGSQGAQGRGSSVDRKVFRPLSDEDSDRPSWAGVKGGKAGGGGKPFDAGIKKGDLYGEMYVLLRDENGEPILADDLIQVIAFVYDSAMNFVPLLDGDGNLVVIPRNEEGDLETSVTLGGTTYDVYPAEVDLGRLSVARSPSKVIDHALATALDKLSSGVVTLDVTGRLVVDGATIDSPLENLALYTAYMTNDETLAGITLPDEFNVAALLAAAGDKTGTFVMDTVVYLNSILGINSPTEYYDFTDYEYDRLNTWELAEVRVLVLQPDGSYVADTVNIYETVFSFTDWTDTTDGGADDFATAADDYLRVIEFVHDNALR